MRIKKSCIFLLVLYIQTDAFQTHHEENVPTWAFLGDTVRFDQAGRLVVAPPPPPSSPPLSPVRIVSPPPSPARSASPPPVKQVLPPSSPQPSSTSKIVSPPPPPMMRAPPSTPPVSPIKQAPPMMRAPPSTPPVSPVKQAPPPPMMRAPPSTPPVSPVRSPVKQAPLPPPPPVGSAVKQPPPPSIMQAQPPPPPPVMQAQPPPPPPVMQAQPPSPSSVDPQNFPSLRESMRQRRREARRLGRKSGPIKRLKRNRNSHKRLRADAPFKVSLPFVPQTQQQQAPNMRESFVHQQAQAVQAIPPPLGISWEGKQQATISAPWASTAGLSQGVAPMAYMNQQASIPPPLTSMNNYPKAIMNQNAPAPPHLTTTDPMASFMSEQARTVMNQYGTAPPVEDDFKDTTSFREWVPTEPPPQELLDNWAKANANNQTLAPPPQESQSQPPSNQPSKETNQAGSVDSKTSASSPPRPPPLTSSADAKIPIEDSKPVKSPPKAPPLPPNHDPKVNIYRDALVRGVLYSLVSIPRFTKKLMESSASEDKDKDGVRSDAAKFVKSLNSLMATGNMTGGSGGEKAVKLVVREINEAKCTSTKHIFRRIVTLLPPEYQHLFIRRPSEKQQQLGQKATSVGDELGKAIVYTCPTGNIIEALVAMGVAPKILPITCTLDKTISDKKSMLDEMPIDVPLKSLNSKKKKEEVKAVRYVYQLASVVWYQDDYVWSLRELPKQSKGSDDESANEAAHVPSKSVVIVYRYRRDSNGDVVAVEKRIIDPTRATSNAAKMVTLSPTEASEELNKGNRIRLYLYERVRETRVSLAARFRTGLNMIDYPVSKLLDWVQRAPSRLTAILHSIFSQMSVIKMVGIGALVVLVVAVVLTSAGIVPGPYFVMSNFYKQPLVSNLTMPITEFLQSSRQVQCEMLLSAFKQVQGITQQLLGYIASNVMPAIFGVLTKGLSLAKDALIGQVSSGSAISSVLLSTGIEKAIELTGKVMDSQTTSQAGELTKASSMLHVGMGAVQTVSKAFSSVSKWFNTSGGAAEIVKVEDTKKVVESFSPCKIITDWFGAGVKT